LVGLIEPDPSSSTAKDHRFTNKIGKVSTLVFGATVSVIMGLIYAKFGNTPFPLVVTVNAILFIV
jgi:type III secretory pathway component EscU